jgi:hypothetical protein
MAYSGSQITRLGISAFARGLYGSFAGKATAVTTAGPGFGINARITNNGLGLVSAINNFGLGKDGLIVIGFGSSATMTNYGIGNTGLINNDGISENGEI